MAPGKIASQAGHAFLGAFQASQGTPEHSAYAFLSPGTKVTLQGSLEQLGRAVEKLEWAGIPHYLMIDSGCPDFFGGKPIITALGIGPATRSQVSNITRRFQLL
jgi:PTH2 family peptidyl-tRNA hydrolase